MLTVCGLLTAMLAGMVMLTRISIKVRLAWSTAAQMGFMLLECGVGLYSLAALHLIGHSLYKAHAFLSAASAVRNTRLQSMRGTGMPTSNSLLLAPPIAVLTIWLLLHVVHSVSWPWWWTAVLGLAWAPFLWLPLRHTGLRHRLVHGLCGLLMVALLTGAAVLAHTLPLGIVDASSNTPLGQVALTGMTALYLFLALLQWRPQALRVWRRWSYAGFYVDAFYTRLALHWWPARWTPHTASVANASAVWGQRPDHLPCPPLDTETPSDASAPSQHAIDAACEAACRAIAPTWPLDRAIAVNPHWSRIGMPVRRVAARMAVLADMQVFPPRSLQQQAWNSGRIEPQDLAYALQSLTAAKAQGLMQTHCLDALQSAPTLQQLPLLIDVLDDDPQRHTRLSWREAITHQVSQACAAYFDVQQADWQPERSQGLYAFWRETLQHDHGIGVLMGAPELHRSLKALPPTHEDAQRWVLQRLGLPPAVWAEYLEAVLLTVNGWASWCAYLGWQARLAGGTDQHLRELLAIRLAWGAILLECKGEAASQQAVAALQNAWKRAPALLQAAEDALLVDEIWQIALERGFQRQLAEQLLQTADPNLPVQQLVQVPRQVQVQVQAAFCIDVRSEPMRRALETAFPGMQTIGFAGFFGLPMAYTPFATSATRPQLPGLLAPSVHATDSLVCPMPSGGHDATASAALRVAAEQARTDRLTWTAQWNAASRWPSAAFSAVESFGMGYLGSMGQWLRPGQHDRPRDDQYGVPARYRPMCRPQLLGLDLEAQITLAAGILRAMGLTQDLAPLVLLVGHGSQSHNNAHAAALDCGACCGQTGEVNARSLALLLNTVSVRSGLRAHGISIPDDTQFVAALHNTTTDDIEGFDLDLVSGMGRSSWDRLQPTLTRAGEQVRRERAQALGLNPAARPTELHQQLRQRANDGAQTRPEWGLANNAALLIAPRKRSHGLPLNGRSFLHDYDAEQDPDGSRLEMLMTAPMLVSHWINWQYHASTCDPVHLGSGNKLLHNVVGGNIGVFEGNGGDLRVGLSRQSVHDGTRCMHEPLRLTVVLDAPQWAIARVLEKHSVVRQLVDNGWLHLWRFEGTKLLRYAGGNWDAVEPEIPCSLIGKNS